jgi:putative transposase
MGKEHEMRGPKPPAVALTAAEHEGLETLVRRRLTPQQIALRARVVLAADEGANNSQIARRLGVSLDMVRLWRSRWLALQPASLEDLPLEDRLQDAPRPGAPRRITDAQVCQIMAMACEAPAQSGRPISQWTGREIAAEAQRRGIVTALSARHAARLLKRGTCSCTAGGTG